MAKTETTKKLEKTKHIKINIDPEIDRGIKNCIKTYKKVFMEVKQ